MNKNFPRASRGVGGALGVDASYAVAPQLPSEMTDLGGPAVSQVINLFQNVIAPTFSNLINAAEEGKEPVNIGKAASKAMPIWKHWNRLIDQIVTKDGWIKNNQGDPVAHIDNLAGFITKSLIGVESLDVSRVSVAEGNEYEKVQRRQNLKKETIKTSIDDILSGDGLDEETLERIGHLGIKSNSLKQEAQDRYLSPRIRRLRRTERMRKGEIIENYPDQYDY
jgi:hypothetical protein